MRFSIAVKLAGVFTVVNISLLLLAAIIASVMTTEGIRTEAFKRLDSDIAVTLHTFDYFEEDALTSARMVANTPRVVRFIAASEKDPKELQEVMDILPKKQIIRCFDRNGAPLWGPKTAKLDAGVPLALAGESATGVGLTEEGLVVRGIVPVLSHGNVVGAVAVGTKLDQGFVNQIKKITGQEVGIAGGDSRASRWLAQTIVAKGKRLSGELPLSVVNQARTTGKLIRENVVIDAHPYIAAFAPLFGDYGEFVGLLFIGASEAPYNELVHRAQLYIVILALVGALFATLIATLLSKTITDSLRQLVGQATIIAKGDLDQRLTIKSGDELEQLANAFNQMSESLAIMKVRDQNANPLTKLPGNLVIEEEIQSRLKNNHPLAVLYTDLDNFKAFNDKFGFEQGDRVIIMTADVLRGSIRSTKILLPLEEASEDFVGHIGGDDFIVITVPDRAELLCREIIRRFDEEIPALYPAEDRQRGFIESTDRRGKQQTFPLCSISIAIVTNEQRKINDFLELSSLAAEVKKFAKSQDGSAFARDRRTDRAPAPPIEKTENA